MHEPSALLHVPFRPQLPVHWESPGPPQNGIVVVVEVVQLPPQASQQLAQVPTTPPRAVQLAASPRTRHVTPADPGKQQVTRPGRPQVDVEAHRRTAARQLAGSSPRLVRFRSTRRAQRR